MKKILKIKNLKKIYHTTKEEIVAVDNFSFDIQEGEFLAIVGPSGCGKSTILSILCGLDNLSEGTINIENNYTIGYMLQKDSLFDWLTIYDNCLIGLKVKKTLNEKSKKYVNDLLDLYGLKEFKKLYPNSLSGGMRQRVE